jgi:hypothetical protein
MRCEAPVFQFSISRTDSGTFQEHLRTFCERIMNKCSFYRLTPLELFVMTGSIGGGAPLRAVRLVICHLFRSIIDTCTTSGFHRLFRAMGRNHVLKIAGICTEI